MIDIKMIDVYKGLIVLEGWVAFHDSVWIEYEELDTLEFKHPGCYWMVLEW